MRIPVFILPLLLAGKLAAQDMPSVKDQAKQYVDTLAAVSYTHLTLPTSDLV